MEAPPNLPRVCGRAMAWAWAVPMAIAMASPSAVAYSPPKFRVKSESAYVRSTNTSCETPGKKNCTTTAEQHFDFSDLNNCTKTANELSLACGPFKLYHREELWYAIAGEFTDGVNVTVARQTDFPSNPPVKGLTYLHTDIYWLYLKDGQRTYITNADMEKCPAFQEEVRRLPNLEPVNEKEREPLEEDKEKNYYVLRSKTLPTEEIHLGLIACEPGFPDFVDYILLVTVFEGKGPDKSEEELHAENLQSKSSLRNLVNWCDLNSEDCPETQGDFEERIHDCFSTYTEDDCPAVQRAFTGTLRVAGLKNRCNPSANRLVYRMPPEVLKASLALGNLRSKSVEGNQAKIDFRSVSIVLKGEKALVCDSEATLIEINELNPESARRACTLELVDQDTGTTTKALETRRFVGLGNTDLSIENPSIKSFPYNSSSLVITDINSICDVHHRIDVNASFTFEFIITFPPPPPTTTTTTTTTTPLEKSAEATITWKSAFVRSSDGSFNDEYCIQDLIDRDDCTETVNNLSPGCQFEFHYRAKLKTSKPITETDLFVPLNATKPDKLPEGLEFLHTSIYFLRRPTLTLISFLLNSRGDDGTEYITAADTEACPERYKGRIGSVEVKDGDYFALQVTTAPEEDIHVGTIKCLGNFPDVKHVLVQTVYSGSRPQLIVLNTTTTSTTTTSTTTTTTTTTTPARTLLEESTEDESKEVETNDEVLDTSGGGSGPGGPPGGGQGLVTSIVQGGGTNNVSGGDGGSSSGESSSTRSPQQQVNAPGQGHNASDGTAQSSGSVTPAPEKPAPPIATDPPKAPAPAPVAESSTAAAFPLKGALSVASGLSLGLIVLLTMGVTRY